MINSSCTSIFKYYQIRLWWRVQQSYSAQPSTKVLPSAWRVSPHLWLFFTDILAWLFPILFGIFPFGSSPSISSCGRYADLRAKFCRGFLCSTTSAALVLVLFSQPSHFSIFLRCFWLFSFFLPIEGWSSSCAKLRNLGYDWLVSFFIITSGAVFIS